MKNLFLTSVLFICFTIAAQENVIKVNYDFYLDIGGNEHFDAELLLSDTEGLFLWGKPTQIIEEKNDNELLVNLNEKDSVGSFTYTSKSKDSMYSRVPYVNKSSFLVKEPIPQIKWEIQKETKKIGPYTSQKAIGTFRGREYTAWFTFEIPISSGPWKLNGLPGLIIKASDSAGEIQFMLKSITTHTNSINPNLKVDKEISIEEYKKLQRSFSDDLLKKMKSKLPRGAEVELTSRKAMEIFELEN